MLKNEKGMTLLELIIAVSILALVVGPYFTQFVTATEIGERSERIVRAEYVAQKKLEEIKNIPIPLESGYKQLIDGFNVTVTYYDQTDTVNEATGELEYFDNEIIGDLILRPSVGPADVDVSFRKDNEDVLKTAYNIKDDQTLEIILDEGIANDQYDLSYRIDTGTPIGLTTINKSIDEEVHVELYTPSFDSIGNKLNVSIRNNTKYASVDNTERMINVYEFDDDNKNISVSRHSESTGQIALFLKLSSASEAIVNNDLDYYWVHVEVKDSSNNVLSELYSSVRKK